MLIFFNFLFALQVQHEMNNFSSIIKFFDRLAYTCSGTGPPTEVLYFKATISHLRPFHKAKLLIVLQL